MHCVCVQVRSLDTQLHPERLKVITQQVEEEQALIQSQTLLRLQQIHAADRQTQVRRANFHTKKWKQSQSLPTFRHVICQSHVDSRLVCFSGVGSTHSACSNPPPHSHRPSSDTKPAPPPSRHGGDHEPIGPHQHCVHVKTEPGHHCAGMCYFE